MNNEYDNEKFFEEYAKMSRSKEGFEEAISDIDELSNHSVGFQTGTTSNIFVEDKVNTGDLENVNTNMYDKAMDAFSDLELGRIEYVICDSSVADIYV